MTNEAPIRVLIADDHAVVRGGLEFFISSLDNVELVGQANNGQKAVQLCAQLQPDVILMDIEMPQMDGIEATKIICEQHPATQIVVLTSFNEPDLIQEALSAGATSYLLKDSSAKTLQEAIVAAAQGRSTLSPEVSQTLIQQISSQTKQQIGSDLTRRELQVLEGIVDAQSNPEIAAALNISRNTVRFHVRNILTKLNACNRTEVATIAMKHDLV